MTIKITDAFDGGAAGYDIVVDVDANCEDDPVDGRIMLMHFGSYESSKVNGESKANYLQRVKSEVQIAARARRSELAAKTNPVKLTSFIGADLT